MNRYRISLKFNERGNWEVNNSDILVCNGLKELKEALRIIKEETNEEVDRIYKKIPHGCYEDVTKRYYKKTQ